MSNDSHCLSVVHVEYYQAVLDGFHMPIAQFGVEYDGGFESVSDKVGNELRARSDLHSKGDSNSDGNTLVTCVSDFK